MNKIESFITSLYPGTEITEKIFFPSKKNQVTKLILAEKSKTFSVICKFFVWGSAEKEETVLNECLKKEIAVPKVIKRHENILLLESLPGRAICLQDIFSSSNQINTKLLEDIAAWLYKFHQSFKKNETTLLKGDMRPHNFILSDNDIFGIDFEESSRGDYMEDIAEMSATLCEIEINKRKVFSTKASNIFSQKYFELSGEEIRNFKELIINCLQKRKAYSDVKALDYFYISN